MKKENEKMCALSKRRKIYMSMRVLSGMLDVEDSQRVCRGI
jgi:hypothetical protein